MNTWDHEELSPELQKFLEAATQFCAAIEASHRYELNERLVRVAGVVAYLYHAALYLPLVNEPDDRTEPPVPPEVADWQGFEELSLFWQVPDAYAWGAPVVGSLNDTLLSIYRDVKRGLLIFLLGQEAGDADVLAWAVWHWRETMEKHWGAHAVDALRALHRAIEKVVNDQRDF